MQEKFSIIIPTLQKNINILTKLIDELNCDNTIGEIIVIDNSRKGFIYNSDKIRVVTPRKNLFVNPSWNLGVKLSKYNFIGILNDDILIPKNLCKKILDKLLSDNAVGLIGMKSEDLICLEEKEFGLYPEDSKINFVRQNDDLYINHWGITIFGRKDNFYKIPERIKIYCGDNFLIHKNELNKKINYQITNCNIKHCGSLSCGSENFSKIKQKDVYYYSKIDKRFKEHNWYSKFPSVLETIFSVCNTRKHKKITIFGIQIKFKSKKLLKRNNIDSNSFMEDIFSIKNHYIHKIITILGIKFKFKSKKLLKKYNVDKNSFFEDIFSIKNLKTGILRRKVITILWIKIIKFQYLPKIEIPKYDRPLVSIIIPVFNQYAYTINCLDSIQKNIGHIPFEIIIADDCSTDETKNIKNKIKNIVVSRNNSNLGYIKNCNNAAKLAKGKYLYFLNNDTEVQQNWLQEMLNVFENHNEAGVVGSKILNLNGTLQECGVYMFKDIFHNQIRGCNNNDSKYNCLSQCDYVSGCSLLTPKKLFDKVGGFDIKFSPAYYDDPDYCLSVLSKGFKTYVQPKSKIIHFGSISYNNEGKALMERNYKIFKEKWRDFFDTRINYDRRRDYTGLTRKATILVIDDLLPQFDKHAGGKTIFQFLELFSKMNLNIKFCPLFGDNYEEPYYSILTNMGIEIIKKEHIHSWIDDNIGYLDYIVLSRPQVAENFMIKSIRARGVKVLYYGHDLHHVRMKRECSYKKDADLKEITRIEKVEKSAITFSDVSLYPSITEKKYVKDIFKSDNVEVVTPYLYDTNKMIKHSSFEESKDIVFVGSSHGPNLDGLLWFINNVLPLIIKKIPNICLNIVGSSVADEILEIKSPNIKVIGYLSEEELNILYSKIKLSIAPLRYGAGIKGKIIDSLYHSTPVVTTSIGIEGINNEYDLVKYSDDVEEFAQKLITLYTKANEWNKLIPLYSKFIQENYSFDVAEKTFRQIINTTEKENKERVL